MYTVFKTGGKHYRAVKGKTVRVEKLPYTEGEMLSWEGVTFGAGEGGNTMEAVTIRARPIGIVKEPKIIVFTKNRRHNSRHKQGHRQQLLWATITDIVPQIKQTK